METITWMWFRRERKWRIFWPRMYNQRRNYWDVIRFMCLVRGPFYDINRVYWCTLVIKLSRGRSQLKRRGLARNLKKK